MHFDLDAIKKNQVKAYDDYIVAEAFLEDGDTAYHPYSGKAVFVGPGWVTYYIHPTATYAYPTVGVTEKKVR